MINGQLLCRVRAGVTLSFKLKEERSSGATRPCGGGAGGGRLAPARQDPVGRQNFWIEDMKSTNGTFLNGQAAEDRLQHLDVITLGREERTSSSCCALPRWRRPGRAIVDASLTAVGEA